MAAEVSAVSTGQLILRSTENVQNYKYFAVNKLTNKQNKQYAFLTFYRATLSFSAVLAVALCLSVCLFVSVTSPVLSNCLNCIDCKVVANYRNLLIQNAMKTFTVIIHHD